MIFVILLSGCGSTNMIVKDEKDNLRFMSKDVKKITEKEKTLLDEMKNVIEETGAAGLAAPQIGTNKRIIIVNGVEMINPAIVSSTGILTRIETSLSVPGVSAVVKRSNEIKLQFMDRNGKKQRKTFKNSIAADIQQQVELLNGVMFYENAYHVWGE
jgi:peptide deformylase